MKYGANMERTEEPVFRPKVLTSDQLNATKFRVSISDEAAGFEFSCPKMIALRL